MSNQSRLYYSQVVMCVYMVVYICSPMKPAKVAAPVSKSAIKTTTAAVVRPVANAASGATTRSVVAAPSHNPTKPAVVPATLLARRNPPKDQLKHMRVVQRNLVYVIGLAPSVARESLLEKPDYFGQYGRIVKLVVNKQVC